MSRRCTFPEKEQLSKAAAKARAQQLNRTAFDGSRVQAYPCPGGGHHHVGHRRFRLGRRRRT